MDEDAETYIELYGEYVSLKELTIASLISIAFAFLLYYFAPYIAMRSNPSLINALKITLGAIGASIGFLISIPITKVKRVIIEEN
ncbi:hypothetical protein IOK49_05795 [Fervidicoccus fontis]|uniref:Uncharacterized protein n=2 Tax=Fervidicoccus fontis TaxID=683846 RepID=I0A1D5_FERFK|nr:hypothetical protein [Fervidicoccus fontis]AFH42792.1 hypothetical protein FFONT_0804 [Fervidicoccus fontis Kam940]MBE9391578.1 hypothetical protein [Fervidicoccus fontis]HEW64141.1 hypothetical protein [Fervidicoccus fontis]